MLNCRVQPGLKTLTDIRKVLLIGLLEDVFLSHGKENCSQLAISPTLFVQEADKKAPTKKDDCNLVNFMHNTISIPVGSY